MRDIIDIGITSRDAAKKNKAYLRGKSTSLLSLLQRGPRISARCRIQIHNSSFVNNTIGIASAIKAQKVQFVNARL
jgi:hypothetical protein